MEIMKEIMEYSLMAGMAAMIWVAVVAGLVLAWKVFKE